MRGKSLALLILALGCGLVASLGITQVLAKRGDTSAPADITPVFVAKADINSGAPLNPDNVKLEQWPKERVPAGAVIRQEDIDGRRARQKIYAGEPVIEPKLLARGQVPTDGLVPKGLRVVPVPVSAEAIHSGLVLPGARCDVQVFIRADPNLGVGETLCKTILQDIRVFAVNDVTSTESADPKTPDTRSIPAGKTVSLLVTPTQAQIVTLASQLGSIRLILRSGDDSEQAKTAVMTAHELIGSDGVGDRAKENPDKQREKDFLAWAEQMRALLRQAKADPAKSQARDESQRFTMRVRSGTDVNDVLLINNSGVQNMPGDEGAWTATGMGPISRPKPNVEIHASKQAEAGPAVPPVGPANLPKPAANVLPPSLGLGGLRPTGT